MSESLITDCEGDGTLPRSASRVVALVFIAVLGGAAIVDTFFPSHDAVPVGAERRDLLRQEAEANLADGSLARLFETKLRMRSRVRQTVVPWWSAFLLRTTGDALRSLVVGEGDVLLIRSRLEIPSLDPEPLAETGVRVLAALERRLETAGTRMVMVPIPRKAAVCAELLPPGTDGRVDVDRTVIGRLREEGMETVDLFDAWRTLDPMQIYMRYDSHWGAAGQRAAARAVAEVVGTSGPTEIELVVDRVELEEARSLQMTGIPPESRAARWIPIAEHERYRLVPPEVDAVVRDRSRWQDRVIVGSSYTQGRDFALMLSAELDEPVWEQGYIARPFPEHLARFFRELGDRPFPRLLLWEFALHEVLNDGRAMSPLEREALGLVWSTAPSASGTPVSEETPVLDRKGAQILLGNGRAESTGDGVLGVRLRGDGLDGTRWTYESRWMRWSFRWPRETSEVVVPIIHAPGERPRIAITALDGEDALARTSATVEVVGAPRALRSGTLAPRKKDSEWRAEILGEPLQVPEHAALLLKTPSKPRAGEVSVVATTADGARRSWTMSPGHDGVVAISLQSFAGRRIASIEVSTRVAPNVVAGRAWSIVAP